MDGRVDDSLARNLDLVATIADLLGTNIFYRQDGRSAFSAETRKREEIAVRTRDFAQLVRIGLPELQERRARWRLRWARLFGTGAESELLYGDPWTRAYRIGPHRELLDRRVARLRVRAPGPERAGVPQATLYARVSRRAQILPTRVTGPLVGVPAGEHRDLALAVNGRIRAVGRSFDFSRKRREYYSFMVPETALRAGANRLELFEVHPDRALVRVGEL